VALLVSEMPGQAVGPGRPVSVWRGHSVKIFSQFSPQDLVLAGSSASERARLVSPAHRRAGSWVMRAILKGMILAGVDVDEARLTAGM
jgi:hypothetical protein